jgi:DNA-binding NtrC family response regulator
VFAVKVMVVDDEPVVRRTMQRLLRRRGFGDCVLCSSGKEAMARLEESQVNVVLLDLLMPGMDGLAVLERAKPKHPLTEFIVITALDDVDQAVKAVRLGAYDYLVKPVDQQRLLLTVERAFERLSMRAGLEGAMTVDAPEAFAHVITVSARMREQLSYASVLAGACRPVLISGPSGTGKELVAKGIHAAGPKADGPFVAVNVAAVPEQLFESQFFGHCKGAFTGAVADSVGLFRQAHGGTLFLDEVGELPLNLQPKLLRVLEARAVTPVGGGGETPVDVCIISATNSDLDKACVEGRFRLDLLYRLRCGHIVLPPLRAREGDIPLLARHYLEEACAEMGRAPLELSPDALARLNAYDFPGNVRELAHLMHTAALRAKGPQVQAGDVLPGLAPVDPLTRRMCSLRENEAQHVAYVLRAVAGDRRQAADILGVSLRQVQRKVASLLEESRWADFLGDI